MRIARHEVSEERLRAATENFAERIADLVDKQQNVEFDHAFGWEMVGMDLLDYAGARSVADPAIDDDAWKALLSAAEAYLGAVYLAGAPKGAPASVTITYTGTGVSYNGVPADTGTLHVSDWLKALYLWIIIGRQDHKRGAFLFIGNRLPEDAGFTHALADYVFGDGALVAKHLDQAAGDAASALRALTDGDQDTFWDAIAGMLTAYRSALSDDPRPRTLLPLEPLALTTLAVRGAGWEQRIESDYLPVRLTSGKAAQ
ncbi:MAG: immunity 49 family protein [Actinomadura rubrobrunea]|nr:immunity 49 family protein [Actinomadura rubrobrunea]